MIRAKQLKGFVTLSQLYKDPIRVVNEEPEMVSNITVCKVISKIIDNGNAVITKEPLVLHFIRDVVLRLKRLGYYVEEHDDHYTITVE